MRASAWFEDLVGLSSRGGEAPQPRQCEVVHPVASCQRAGCGPGADSDAARGAQLMLSVGTALAEWEMERAAGCGCAKGAHC